MKALLTIFSLAVLAIAPAYAQQETTGNWTSVDVQGRGCMLRAALNGGDQFIIHHAPGQEYRAAVIHPDAANGDEGRTFMFVTGNGIHEMPSVGNGEMDVTELVDVRRLLNDIPTAPNVHVAVTVMSWLISTDGFLQASQRFVRCTQQYG